MLLAPAELNTDSSCDIAELLMLRALGSQSGAADILSMYEIVSCRSSSVPVWSHSECLQFVVPAIPCPEEERRVEFPQPNLYCFVLFRVCSIPVHSVVDTQIATLIALQHLE